MKQTFTLLLAAFISLSMYSYPTFSKMSISSTSNAKLRVMVDGNRYKANDNSIMISNLQQGYHSVKVYQFIRGFIPSSPYGYNNNSNYRLVYSANVYVKPQYYVDIIINRFGKAFIDEQPINAGYYDGDDDDWCDDNQLEGIAAPYEVQDMMQKERDGRQRGLEKKLATELGDEVPA